MSLGIVELRSLVCVIIVRKCTTIHKCVVTNQIMHQSETSFRLADLSLSLLSLFSLRFFKQKKNHYVIHSFVSCGIFVTALFFISPFHPPLVSILCSMSLVRPQGLDHLAVVLQKWWNLRTGTLPYMSRFGSMRGPSRTRLR